MGKSSFNRVNRQKLFICAILLNNPEVVTFAKSAIVDGYRENFKGHEEEITTMIDTAFYLLLKSQETGLSVEKLKNAVDTIYKTVFKKNDPDFWFNKMYKEYKYSKRTIKDVSRIEKYIKGNRILDFGTGGGYLAMALSEKGYNVEVTDVVDYRVPEAHVLPFKPMISPVKTSYPDNYFDTVILRSVLHHIDDNSVDMIIDELKRISTKIIVEEDTYNISKKIPRYKYLSHTQPRLREFLSMSLENQFQALMFGCFFSNAVTHGVGYINFAFDFRTIEEWNVKFATHKCEVKDVIVTGFEKNKLTKNCQAWMIYEKKV